MKSILTIDDDNSIRVIFSRTLEGEGFKTYTAGTLKSGWEIIESKQPDLIILDVNLPDGNGVDFTEKVKIKYPQIIIIVLTGYGSIKDGVRAIKHGAFNYIDKSEPRNLLLTLINEAFQVNRVEAKPQLIYQYKHDDRIIGKSHILTNAVKLVEKFSKSDIAILLSGETGSGKELFAEKVHTESSRANKPFVAINCSAIPKDLLESEFFGHVKGAFSGAHKDKTGYFEEANNGTIFLDEISEMSLDLQAKLLRALETGSYSKVGDTKSLRSNVRLISACNKDLKDRIKKGLFRDDLYYRISGVSIEIPPLRDRKDDIEDIANHFIKRFEAQAAKTGLSMSDDFLKTLTSYHWPGNVRELRNVIYRAVVLSDNSMLTCDLLPEELIKNKPKKEEYQGFSLEEVDKAHIEKVMAMVNGNKVEAANLLSIGLTTLYRKIQEYKIEGNYTYSKQKENFL